MASPISLFKITMFFFFKVEYSSQRLIDVLVNGELVVFDEQSELDYSEVSVVKQNESRIRIYFGAGVSLTVIAIEQFLNYEILIPQRFKGWYLISLYLRYATRP